MMLSSYHYDIAYNLIAKEEGYKAAPYKDTEGYPTIGYGLKIGYQGQNLMKDFAEFPHMPEKVARAWMEHIVRLMIKDMLAQPAIAEALEKCNEVRFAVLVSMAYQLGVFGLSKFRKTLDYIKRERFCDAATEMLDSEWARQTPNRAERQSKLMADGHG